MGRTPITVAMVLAWLVALAGRAAAHSAGGQDATNYRTRLLEVTPPVPGVEVDVIENGARLELTNRSDQEVVVLGYQEEPYLRVGPEGVFENQRSPATYLNEDRQGTTTVPGSADPAAPPDWKKISGGDTARWHDHRAHWMGEQDPVSVQRDPDRRQTIIPEWRVNLQSGDRTASVVGDLVWVPGPSPWPWFALAAALVAGTVALVFLPARSITLAAVVVALIGIDVVHVVGVGLAAGGSAGAGIGSALTGSIASMVGWGAGLGAVVLLARGHRLGLYLAGFAGLLIAINGGFIDVADLSRSQIPTALAPALARAVVAASIGLGVGLAGAALVGAWRQNAGPTAAGPEGPEPAAVDQPLRTAQTA